MTRADPAEGHRLPLDHASTGHADAGHLLCATYRYGSAPGRYAEEGRVQDVCTPGFQVLRYLLYLGCSQGDSLCRMHHELSAEDVILPGSHVPAGCSLLRPPRSRCTRAILRPPPGAIALVGSAGTERVAALAGSVAAFRGLWPLSLPGIRLPTAWGRPPLAARSQLHPCDREVGGRGRRRPVAALPRTPEAFPAFGKSDYL